MKIENVIGHGDYSAKIRMLLAVYYQVVNNKLSSASTKRTVKRKISSSAMGIEFQTSHCWFK